MNNRNENTTNQQGRQTTGSMNSSTGFNSNSGDQQSKTGQPYSGAQDAQGGSSQQGSKETGTSTGSVYGQKQTAGQSKDNKTTGQEWNKQSGTEQSKADNSVKGSRAANNSDILEENEKSDGRSQWERPTGSSTDRSSEEKTTSRY